MNLLIENALGNCKYPNTCVCTVKSSYELINDNVFYILDEGEDSKNPVKVVKKEDIYQLTVNNNGNKEICIIKTDKCLIPNEISKCDCIVTSNTESHLVEIKSCSAGSRSKRRAKAVEQLKNTIDYLQLSEISLSAHKLRH